MRPHLYIIRFGRLERFAQKTAHTSTKQKRKIWILQRLFQIREEQEVGANISSSLFWLHGCMTVLIHAVNMKRLIACPSRSVFKEPLFGYWPICLSRRGVACGMTFAVSTWHTSKLTSPKLRTAVSWYEKIITPNFSEGLLCTVFHVWKKKCNRKIRVSHWGLRILFNSIFHVWTRFFSLKYSTPCS